MIIDIKNVKKNSLKGQTERWDGILSLRSFVK